MMYCFNVHKIWLMTSWSSYSLAFFFALLLATRCGAQSYHEERGSYDLESDSHAHRNTNNHNVEQLPLFENPVEEPDTRVSVEEHDLVHQIESALKTMQSRFFEIWLGTWPTTIDWTGAVMSTYVSSALSSLSRAATYYMHEKDSHIGGIAGLDTEDSVNRYFSQVTAYYFGEDAFSLRTQAHDDMLWVVLGWLEGIRLMDLHSKLHHQIVNRGGPAWWGKQYAPAFAHRSHVFYDLVAKNWDTSKCGGGLTWNPSLLTYKNTITNTQFISASIAMYLYHPGDQNTSPFLTEKSTRTSSSSFRTSLNNVTLNPHDAAHLALAKEAYDWLAAVNLTNAQGLYVDGYHISSQNRNASHKGPAQCDERNEMVYTYNQGPVLSGSRGLWEATGNMSYLTDGHALVRNVIAATGFDLDSRQAPLTRDSEWHGLGSAGILTEACDPSGTCSQDSQTFKGIFFAHLASFCAPLPTLPSQRLVPGLTFIADRGLAALHRQSCEGYGAWVALNARAALRTRDEHGLFGMWWGASPVGLKRSKQFLDVPLPAGAIDVRGPAGVPWSKQWRRTSDVKIENESNMNQKRGEALHMDLDASNDSNDRGRGRTVETQGGGVMVLKALWELTYGQVLH